jgi:hypothetical protein
VRTVLTATCEVGARSFRLHVFKLVIQVKVGTSVLP